jgi:hypothetical protein
MDRNYGGVIWTNHALARLSQRGIKQGDAWATWKNPDQARYAVIKGAWVYYRTYDDTKIEVVAKQNEKKEWVILSVWSKPADRKYSKKPAESFLDLIIRRIMGGDRSRRT